MTTQINTREEYVAFRANWKESYKELSTEIRQGRRELANAFREGSHKASRLQIDLLANRRLANRMMEQLEEIKAQAKASREAHQASKHQQEAA
jgi:hypothetical protein